MRITAIESSPVTVPIIESLVIRGARGAHDKSPFVLLRIHTDEGVSGIGEISCTPIWSGEDQVTAKHFVDNLLGPALIGESPLNIHRIGSIMRQVLANNPFTKAGIEMACWDIVGKLAGVPLYRLWGGPARREIPIKFSVSAAPPKEAAAIAEFAVEQGFVNMKVKVGTDPSEDIDRFREVRKAVGDRIRIGADANGGWNVRHAIEMVKKLEQYDLWFIEQPVPPGDHIRMAEVRAHIETSVLADESVETPEDALSIINMRAADGLSAYVGKGGGIETARQVASVANAGRINCTLGSNLELGVASAAMIHLAAASPHFTCEQSPPDILGPLYYEADVLCEPLNLRNGLAQLPNGAGLGVEINDAMIERYQSS